MDLIGSILEKIGEPFGGWEIESAGMTRDTFCNILMTGKPPVCQSIRTAYEKWNTLITLGFATKRNKTTVSFNVERIRAYLDSQREI